MRPDTGRRPSEIIFISRMPISPSDHLPRERLQQFGVSYLRDHELLAILLGSGTSGLDVITLSKLLLKRIDHLSSEKITLSFLQSVPGVGPAKGATVLAALEFARRRFGTLKTKVRSAEQAASLLSHLGDRSQEHLVCLSLNGAHELIALRTVTIGLVNMTQVHPREVFSDALKDRACAIIVGHNHPSDNLEPSPEDIRITQMLTAAGTLLGIELLDHLIIGRNGYVSLRERGYCSTASASDSYALLNAALG